MNKSLEFFDIYDIFDIFDKFEISISYILFVNHLCVLNIYKKINQVYTYKYIYIFVYSKHITVFFIDIQNIHTIRSGYQKICDCKLTHVQTLFYKLLQI